MIEQWGDFHVEYDNHGMKLAFYKPAEKYSLYDEISKDQVLRSPCEFEGVRGDIPLYYLYSRVLNDVLNKQGPVVTKPFSVSLNPVLSPDLMQTIRKENFGDYVGMGMVHAHKDQIMRLFQTKTHRDIAALSVHIGYHSHTHNGFTVNALNKGLRREAEETMVGINLEECKNPKYVISILSRLFGVSERLFPAKQVSAHPLNAEGMSANGSGLMVWPPQEIQNDEGFNIIVRDKIYEGLQEDKDILFDFPPLHGLTQLCNPDKQNKLKITVGLLDNAFNYMEDAYRAESLKFNKKREARDEEGHIHHSEYRQLWEAFHKGKSALLQFFAADKIAIEKTMEYIPTLGYVEIAVITFLSNTWEVINTKKIWLIIEKDGVIKNIQNVVSCLMQSWLRKPTASAHPKDSIIMLS